LHLPREVAESALLGGEGHRGSAEDRGAGGESRHLIGRAEIERVDHVGGIVEHLGHLLGPVAGHLPSSGRQVGRYADVGLFGGDRSGAFPRSSAVAR